MTTNQYFGEGALIWAFYLHSKQYGLAKWVTVGEVAKWLGVTKPTAQKWLKGIGGHLLESDTVPNRGKKSNIYKMVWSAYKTCEQGSELWAQLARSHYDTYQSVINKNTKGQ